MTKSTPANPIKSNPATFTGRIAAIYNASTNAIVPATPGRMAPGVVTSPTSPTIAINIKMNMVSGRQNIWDRRSANDILISTIFALAVSSRLP